MTSTLDRRLAKLEAAASAAAGSGTAVHVAFVHPGEDAGAKVAELGPIRRDDNLIVVHFRRPGDVPQLGTTLQ